MTRALVVGAPSDIGRAVAADRATAGSDVVLWGRDEQRLRATAGQCAGRAVVDAVDVTDRAQVRAALDRVLADGPLHTVVWAAGTFDWAPADQADAGTWQHLLDVNLTAAAVLTTMVLPPLLAAAPSAPRCASSSTSRAPAAPSRSSCSRSARRRPALAQPTGTVPSAAAWSAARSSLRIPSIACIARCARSGSASAKTSSMPIGMTCQDSP